MVLSTWMAVRALAALPFLADRSPPGRSGDGALPSGHDAARVRGADQNRARRRTDAR